uniref:SFRICE_024610 n=1 Tax=Spodoptera frugiperda TaxID=7108 RepID=A0A2H1V8U4_SPOFR
MLCASKPRPWKIRADCF